MEMTMKSIFAAAVLAAALVPGVAHAGTDTILTTVDDVHREPERQYRLVLTGIVSGEPAPRTLTIDFYSPGSSYSTPEADHCERYALMAMSRPGRYSLDVFVRGVQGDVTVAFWCKLKRND
jgi:hypothetical protein